MKKLDADGKTVIITDPHLFPKKRDNDYKNGLLDVLEALKCKEVIYIHKTVRIIPKYCGGIREKRNLGEGDKSYDADS